MAAIPTTSSLGSFGKHPLFTFLKSSIGRKWIVALTGLGLLGFVIGHLVGNLQFFLPNHSQINLYGTKLRELGPLLWAVRLGLLAIFVIHIVATISLVLENKKARPEKYTKFKPQSSTLASRTMALSGLTVLAFVIYHILHFTLIAFNANYRSLIDAAGNPDVYTRMILGFRNPLISGFYILSIALLCTHLSHGISSTVQTLGIRSKRVATLVQKGGLALAVIIAVGFISMPVAVLLGCMPFPDWYQPAP